MGLVSLVASLPLLSTAVETFDPPEVRYPLRSHFMRPAFMTQFRWMKKSSTTRSFAVVGDEGLSVNWLRQNSTKLKEMNAIVLVVSAFSKEEYEVLVEAANGATIMLMPDDEAILDALGADVYPVLFDAHNGWIQQ